MELFYPFNIHPTGIERAILSLGGRSYYGSHTPSRTFLFIETQVLKYIFQTIAVQSSVHGIVHRRHDFCISLYYQGRLHGKSLAVAMVKTGMKINVISNLLACNVYFLSLSQRFHPRVTVLIKKKKIRGHFSICKTENFVICSDQN